MPMGATGRMGPRSQKLVQNVLQFSGSAGEGSYGAAMAIPTRDAMVRLGLIACLLISSGGGLGGLLARDG